MLGLSLGQVHLCIVTQSDAKYLNVNAKQTGPPKTEEEIVSSGCPCVDICLIISRINIGDCKTAKRDQQCEKKNYENPQFGVCLSVPSANTILLGVDLLLTNQPGPQKYRKSFQDDPEGDQMIIFSELSSGRLPFSKTPFVVELDSFGPAKAVSCSDKVAMTKRFRRCRSKYISAGTADCCVRFSAKSTTSSFYLPFVSLIFCHFREIGSKTTEMSKRKKVVFHHYKKIRAGRV